MRTALFRAALAAVFVGLVVASNLLTARFGLVAGLVTAGTFTAGLTLLVRDLVHERGGWPAVVACVLAGALISAQFGPARIAVASAAAFAVSELLDAAVYARLRATGRWRASLASNVVGAAVDSVLFLSVAGFAVWPAAGTQTLVKVAVTLLVLAAAYGAARAVLRHRQRA